jgi:hypothetical protein
MVSSGFLSHVGLVRATRRNNPEDTILHSLRRENLKTYHQNCFQKERKKEKGKKKVKAMFCNINQGKYAYIGGSMNKEIYMSNTI